MTVFSDHQTAKRNTLVFAAHTPSKPSDGLQFRDHLLLLVVCSIALTGLFRGSRLFGDSIARNNLSARDQTNRVQSEQLRSYWSEIKSGADFNLASANRIVHANTTHSDDRRIQFSENWVQWTLGQLYEPILQIQDTTRIIDGHKANCSGRSQILKSIAESAGRKCRFVGLDGHVVLEVLEGNRWQVADPDYGILFDESLDELQKPEFERTIRKALRGRYSRKAINTYVSIFQTKDNNVRLEVGQALSPRLYFIEQICAWLVLLTPVPFLAFTQFAFLR